MAPEDDDRFGSDLRDSPPPRSRSYHRSPENDEFPPSDGRDMRENGSRHREVFNFFDSVLTVDISPLLDECF